MGDLNAVHGTEQSDPVAVAASASEVELIEEPKYVSLDDASFSQITLPDESQYIVVTKIGYSMTGTNNFYLHGGEATPVQVGQKIHGVAGVSDVLDVHLRFPMGAPVKGAFSNETGKVTNVWLQYHIVQTQNRIPSSQDYAIA